ncbi:MAG TPA: PilZ domain-containing protein [Rhodospirillales bacterium]|nr:PilZ domain-containing protein [Rhodospirillales bacterium]
MRSPHPPVDGVPEPGEDRRLYRRYAVTLPVRVVQGGESMEAGLLDISLGGAAVLPGRPDWQGRRVRLECGCFGVPEGLAARVLRADGERMHLAFELDQETEDALTMFLMLSAPSP